MRPVVHIIGDVVTAMKPSVSVDCDWIIDTSTWSISGFDSTRLYFVGQKMKYIGTNPAVTAYVTITAIGDNALVVSSTIDLGSTKNKGTIQPVINYHFGHGAEIVNTFSEITKNASYKKEQFPAICLIQDFPEAVKKSDGYECEASLNIVILTDSKQKYKAADRYANTFKPILYPLYDLFIDRLRNSTEIAPDYPEHTKTDRLFWGKSGLYGNSGNIFNDYIDAIELENLKVKIFKTC